MKKKSAQFFFGTSIAAAALLSFHASPAQAAIFSFQFDNTNDGTVTPPIVGTGTLSFDGSPMVGTFPLTSLTNYNFSFVLGSSSFTTADIATPLADILVQISSIGSDFSVRFGGAASGPVFGSIDFVAGSSVLSFQPTFGGLYYSDNPSYFGDYQGLAPVPGPLPFLGIGAALGWSRTLRKRVASSRSEMTNSTLA